MVKSIREHEQSDAGITLAQVFESVTVRYFAFNMWLFAETANEEIKRIFILPRRDARLQRPERFIT